MTLLRDVMSNVMMFSELKFTLEKLRQGEIVVGRNGVNQFIPVLMS